MALEVRLGVEDSEGRAVHVEDLSARAQGTCDRLGVYRDRLGVYRILALLDAAGETVRAS